MVSFRDVAGRMPFVEEVNGFEMEDCACLICNFCVTKVSPTKNEPQFIQDNHSLKNNPEKFWKKSEKLLLYTEGIS